MNRIRTLLTVGVVLSALVAWQPALGTYQSIQHNLVDGTNDTSFNADTGKLEWNSGARTITLNDPMSLGGTIDSASVHLETYLQDYNSGTGVATFLGGSFELLFDWNGSSGYTYHIGGPVEAMLVQIASTSPQLSTIDGEGLFTVENKLLPGSDDWPDGGGFSSIVSLTLAFGVDLSGFEWNQSAGGAVGPGVLQTTYSLLPNDSAAPEPATLLMLLVIGSLGLVRRRV